mmetsp:Transcript_36419/g.93947  ORF Transcript_36419/g.93947 Transcript_36419/m.93947 type:complete len:286 (-) Transcript_36419:1028-1885(-)
MLRLLMKIMPPATTMSARMATRTNMTCVVLSSVAFNFFSWAAPFSCGGECFAGDSTASSAKEELPDTFSTLAALAASRSASSRRPASCDACGPGSRNRSITWPPSAANSMRNVPSASSFITGPVLFQTSSTDAWSPQGRPSSSMGTSKPRAFEPKLTATNATFPVLSSLVHTWWQSRMCAERNSLILQGSGLSSFRRRRRGLHVDVDLAHLQSPLHHVEPLPSGHSPQVRALWLPQLTSASYLDTLNSRLPSWARVMLNFGYAGQVEYTSVAARPEGSWLIAMAS